MVNIAGCSVQVLLNIIEDTISLPEDKTDAYLRLAEGLAKHEKMFVEDICNMSSKLLVVFSRDMFNERKDLCQAALQALGYCVYQQQIASSFCEEEMLQLIKDLCRVIMICGDKNTCTRALWGLAKQQLPSNVIVKKLPMILNTIEHALLTSKSMAVEHEALDVMYRLISELPEENIVSTACQWSKLVYTSLISTAHRVRERALEVLELGLKQIIQAQKEVVIQLLIDLKGGMLSQLANLFSGKRELFVLRTWGILVTILGESLHKGGNFINDMLKIPEQGFRSSLPVVQTKSYSVWMCLIDNFAISPAYIGSSKRIKLLMLPLLKSSSFINEDVECSRLQTWWHLICSIKPEYYCKTSIFCEICLPLLQYFFNVENIPSSIPGHHKEAMTELVLPVTPVSRASLATPSSCKSGDTPRRKKMIFNSSKFDKNFVKKIMTLGCEMFHELLVTNTERIQNGNYLTEHIFEPIMTSGLFHDNLHFFLSTMKAVFCCGELVNADVQLILWKNLVDRIILLIENGEPKDVDDVISSLFLTINDVISSSLLSSSVALKFLDTLTAIPVKYLLHSFENLTAYCDEGKPIFQLTDVLFKQLSHFKESYIDERFHVVFEKLVDLSFEDPFGKLKTVHKIWEILEDLASEISKVEDLWRFWSKVTDSVSECVSKTSDVNEGDSLDPKFTLMVSLLNFPFKRLFNGGLPLVTIKELDRYIADFYRLVARCVSLIPAAEHNICIEEVAKVLLSEVSLERCQKMKFLDSVSSFTNVMIESIDFSSQNHLTSPLSCSRGFLTPSGSFAKKLETPLGNLKSVVTLCCKMLSLSYKFDVDCKRSVTVSPAVVTICTSLSMLFSNLNDPKQIKSIIAALSPSLCSFISHVHCTSPSEFRSSDKKFNNAKYLLKVEKLWSDILLCLQSRYKADYDSSLLETMSDLLECTLCHQRQQFKNQTIVFWNATFGQVKHLSYPDSLSDVLRKVSEKNQLSLPGWQKSSSHLFSFEDSEEITTNDSISAQAQCLPKTSFDPSSPEKLKGSFLFKSISAGKQEHTSPENKRKFPGNFNARRKLPLPLDFLKDKDFVVIAPSPKKKRLLTEHQQEVKNQKKLESGYPALYSTIDQSQDGTQFNEWIESSLNQCDMEKKGDNAAKVINDGSNNEKTPKKQASKNYVQPIKEMLGDEKNEENTFSPSILNCFVSTIDGDFNLKGKEVNKTLTIQSEHIGEDKDAEPKSGGNSDINKVDDDELIPPSQNTPSPYSKQRNDESTENNSKYDTIKKETRFILDDVCSEETRSITKISPVSSRTRYRKKPTPYKQRNKKRGTSLTNTKSTTFSPWDENIQVKNVECCNDQLSTTIEDSFVSENFSTKERAVTDLKKMSSINNWTVDSTYYCGEVENESAQMDSEEFSDHQMDDTQIIQKDEILNINKPSDDIIMENESVGNKPSCSISGSVKFVQSISSTTGRHFDEFYRSVVSPASSPTTGILKKSRGKSETPSPPGKTRRVSFAFPIIDEKIDINEESITETNNFTLIKSANMMLSTPSSDHDDCVYPELVECSTPVEQILPSLATSRFIRGLGHVVHAQNIRTVGNLSSLTKQQVEKLPIRSPKVSTLRRVLRCFHENRLPKCAKSSHLRAIKEIPDDVKNDAFDVSEKIVAPNDSCALNDEEPVGYAVPATPSSSCKFFDKPETPRRSSLVIPTTLFKIKSEITNEIVGGSDCEMNDESETPNNQKSKNQPAVVMCRDDQVKIESETFTENEKVDCIVDVEVRESLTVKDNMKYNADGARIMKKQHEIDDNCEFGKVTSAKEDTADEIDNSIEDVHLEMDKVDKMNIDGGVETKSDLHGVNVNARICTEEKTPELFKTNIMSAGDIFRQVDQDIAMVNKYNNDDRNSSIPKKSCPETVFSYNEISNDFVSCSSLDALNKLPLDELFLIQERLMTMLTNTNDAIRLKYKLMKD